MSGLVVQLPAAWRTRGWCKARDRSCHSVHVAIQEGLVAVKPGCTLLSTLPCTLQGSLRGVNIQEGLVAGKPGCTLLGTLPGTLPGSLRGTLRGVNGLPGRCKGTCSYGERCRSFPARPSLRGPALAP